MNTIVLRITSARIVFTRVALQWPRPHCARTLIASEDLPAHEEHRRRTLTLITQLGARGNTTLADQDRLVLDQLDARIVQTKHAIATATETRNAS